MVGWIRISPGECRTIRAEAKIWKFGSDSSTISQAATRKKTFRTSIDQPLGCRNKGAE